MAKNLSILLLCILLTSSSLLPAIHAVQYTVTNNAKNTPGGKRFDQEIGVDFTLKTLNTITQFIYKLFQQQTPADRRDVKVLNLYISDFNDAWAYTTGASGDNINVSAQAIEQYFPRGQAKWAFTSLLYHEVGHIFQWSGDFTAPGGLTEGVADYVRVKSGFYDEGSYTKPGEGEKWDEGYGVTERFLEYGDSLREGFTVELNKKIRYSYSDDVWVDLLGKSVDALWAEYKAKYANTINSSSSSSTAGSKKADIFHGAKY